LISLERHMQADQRDAAVDQRELDAQTDPKSYSTEGQLRPDPGEP